MKAKLAVGAGIAVVATLIASALAITPFVQRIELATYDWRLQQTARPTSPSGDIVLISIDDDSVRRMAPLVGRWPWPRLTHATLVDFLARGPAELVVYDVLFTEPDNRRFTVGDEEWTGVDVHPPQRPRASGARTFGAAGRDHRVGRVLRRDVDADREPRTATVRAVGDVRVLEISAERFREIALERPGLIDHISGIVSARRVELDQARAAAATAATTVVARTSLFTRIQKFLRLSG